MDGDISDILLLDGSLKRSTSQLISGGEGSTHLQKVAAITAALQSRRVDQQQQPSQLHSQQGDAPLLQASVGAVGREGGREGGAGEVAAIRESGAAGGLGGMFAEEFAMDGMSGGDTATTHDEAFLSDAQLFARTNFDNMSLFSAADVNILRTLRGEPATLAATPSPAPQSEVYPKPSTLNPKPQTLNPKP